MLYNRQLSAHHDRPKGHYATSLGPKFLGSCTCSSRAPEIVRHTVALACWIRGHRDWGKLPQLGRALPGSNHDHNKSRISSFPYLSCGRREEGLDDSGSDLVLATRRAELHRACALVARGYRAALPPE